MSWSARPRAKPRAKPRARADPRATLRFCDAGRPRTHRGGGRSDPRPVVRPGSRRRLLRRAVPLLSEPARPSGPAAVDSARGREYSRRVMAERFDDDGDVATETKKKE